MTDGKVLSDVSDIEMVCDPDVDYDSGGPSTPSSDSESGRIIYTTAFLFVSCVLYPKHFRYVLFICRNLPACNFHPERYMQRSAKM